MNENWGDVRQQLDAILVSEQAQRQALRQQRASLWQRLRQWWTQARENPQQPSHFTLSMLAIKRYESQK